MPSSPMSEPSSASAAAPPALFDQPQVVPLRLPHLELLCATACSAADFNRTPAGCALGRLRLDRRLHIDVLEQLRPAAHGEALRARWRVMARNACMAQTGGVIWLRDDVKVDDYHLAERLAEAWTRQDMVVAHDGEGRPVFWALSRRGAMCWLGRDATPNAPAGAQGAKEAARAVCEGPFPATEIGDAVARGVRGGPWPLSLSFAPASGPPAGGGTPRLSECPGVPLFDARHVAQPAPLLIVCATRETVERFFTHTATGRSITRLRAAGMQVRVSCTCENGAALAKPYNEAIRPQTPDCLVAFMHDDVWIDDCFLAHHLHEGLLRYDVIGVAGNRNRTGHQPAWPFPKVLGQWDAAAHLLGAVAHDSPPGRGRHRDAVSVYGARRGAARLLDGVLLATRMQTLLAAGVRFDERFSFHFYDLDFCRTAEQRGLRLGVWPLAITHLSTGAGGYRSAEWLACWGRYIGKYGD